MTEDELRAMLEEALASPDSMTVDGSSVKGRSLSDIVEALEYLKRSRSLGTTFPVRTMKLRPGGPV